MPNDERDRLERKLCQFLILAREAPGMNQTQLRKAAGRSLPLILSLEGRVHPVILSLSKDERAQRRLDLPDLILVCRAMGVEPVELLRRLY